AEDAAAVAKKLPLPASASGVERVGIWDLGAWLGAGLPRLIDGLNAAQQRVAFFEVKATVPPGLTRDPERVRAWFQKNVKRRLNADDRKEVDENIISNDFFKLADAVRRDLGIEWIVGVTPSMVAGREDDGSA